MISIEQINGEIAALEEEKPTHAVMQKLANLYIVRDHIIINNSSRSPVAAVSSTIPDIGTGSEFGQKVFGQDTNRVMTVIDDLMTTLQVINPRLYDSVMRKL